MASGATPTDFQVRLNVTYSAAMRADFGDLRFKNATGADMSYWLESQSNSNWAVAWVKVPPGLTTSNYTFYAQYGNASLASASNGTATFILFDDFGTFPLSQNWDCYSCAGGYTCGTSGGLLHLAGGGGDSRAYVKSKIETPANISLDFSAAYISGGHQIGGTIHWNGVSGDVAGTCEPDSDFELFYWGGGLLLWKHESGPRTWYTSMVFADDYEFHDFSVSYFNQNVSVSMDGQGNSTTDTTLFATRYVGLFSHEGGGADFDDARVRNYYQPEPVAYFGPEEAAP